MATEPNSGLNDFRGFMDGDSGYADEFQGNILRIGRVGFQLSIIDRDLTSPPGSPADGDRYIVGPAATGDWAGQDDNIAVWDGVTAAWEFYVPKTGWLAYIKDELVLSVYREDSSAWSTGIAI